MGAGRRPTGPSRRERLVRARLYLVIEADPGPRRAEELLLAAFAGGVDMVQLREKSAPDEDIVRAAGLFRRLCDDHGALLVVNDRPDLAVAVGADGVHLGQEDRPVEEVRRELGGELLIGLSTHSPEQFDAGLESSADYLSVGPVHATPTKPGRPAVGEALVRHAAERVRDPRGAKPFFAIGGIDPSNAVAVAAAGAERIAVVRAIRDAPDPRAAAAGLRAALERGATERATQRREAGVGAK